MRKHHDINAASEAQKNLPTCDNCIIVELENINITPISMPAKLYLHITSFDDTLMSCKVFVCEVPLSTTKEYHGLGSSLRTQETRKTFTTRGNDNKNKIWKKKMKTLSHEKIVSFNLNNMKQVIETGLKST